jgi:glycosyltransferase involved in cell wall biosynthesis
MPQRISPFVIYKQPFLEPIRFSLCFPQYNRIEFLLKSLEIIAAQTYSNIEVCISDDASTDDTEQQVAALQKRYRFPLVYHRHEKNVGFDANLRKSLELASGDYLMLLGNDDTLATPDAVAAMIQFLTGNGQPAIGFCNYFDDGKPDAVYSRASRTGVIGTGVDTALKYYRSFSFVAGVIFRKDIFHQHNTAKVDGSIYVQMYLAARIISSGESFFMLQEAHVMKDIRMGGAMANSYRDVLIRKWKDYKQLDGGMPSVIRVVCEGFRDAGKGTTAIFYRVISDIYRYTFLYWLLDYRQNGAFVAAYGLTKGMRPGRIEQVKELNLWQRAKVRWWYSVSSVIGLLMPVFLFRALKNRIYRFIKKTK